MRSSQRDGRTVVFVVRDGKAVEVPVTPGEKIGDLTAITGDVKRGEKAVLKPPRRSRTARWSRSSRSTPRARAIAPMATRPRQRARRRDPRTRKYYVRGEQIIPVLVDINLDVGEGDFVALMGPSGRASARCSI